MSVRYEAPEGVITFDQFKRVGSGDIIGARGGTYLKRKPYLLLTKHYVLYQIQRPWSAGSRVRCRNVGPLVITFIPVNRLLSVQAARAAPMEVKAPMMQVFLNICSPHLLLPIASALDLDAHTYLRHRARAVSETSGCKTNGYSKSWLPSASVKTFLLP